MSPPDPAKSKGDNPFAVLENTPAAASNNKSDNPFAVLENTPPKPQPGHPDGDPFAALMKAPAPDGETKKQETSQTKPVAGGAKDVSLMVLDTSGRYRIGPPQRPAIIHDNGFLDMYPRSEPTARDRMQLALWQARLRGAQLLHHLPHGTDAYEHFLSGKGADRSFDYGEYITGDASGQTMLATIQRDFMYHAEVIGAYRTKYEITSTSYGIGTLYELPYPATEDWQKAIGGHSVWVSATVERKFDPATKKDKFHAVMTLHAEDRYNFNPGAADIATNLPDSANGRFEITGLAHQYTQYGVAVFDVSWDQGVAAPSSTMRTTTKTR